MGGEAGRFLGSPDTYVIGVSDCTLEKYIFNRTITTMKPTTIKSQRGFIVHLVTMEVQAVFPSHLRLLGSFQYSEDVEKSKVFL